MNFEAVRKFFRPSKPEQFVAQFEADYARMKLPVFDVLSQALESTVPQNAGFGRFRAKAAGDDDVEEVKP